MYSVAGAYFINLQCGGVPIPLSPSIVKEFVVTQEMSRLLPTFKTAFTDASGVFTHMTPSDYFIKQWSLDIGVVVDDYTNSFIFDVYRRAEDGESVSSANYNLRGIGNVSNNALCQEYFRSFGTSVTKTITTLANEIGVDAVSISPSLNYALSIVQPGWTTPRLLEYLRRHLTGSNGEVGYLCFMQHRNRKRTLVFRTYNELLAQPSVATYHCGNVGSPDTIRLLSYSIKENPLLSQLAPSSQRYSYFDWATGTYVDTALQFQGNSLSDYLGYDQKELLGNHLHETGRTNPMDQNFLGTVGTSHYARAYNLVQMWITVPGNINLCQGDCVKLVFGASATDVFSTQYSGFWLVDKVAHNFGDRFVTYARLIRNGYDKSSSNTSTLQAATNRKRT